MRIWVPSRTRWERINRGSRIIIQIPRSAEVAIETSSGEITVGRSGGSIRAESSSGTLVAGPTRAEKHLEIGSGRFLIHGKSSSGDQSYR